MEVGGVVVAMHIDHEFSGPSAEISCVLISKKEVTVMKQYGWMQRLHPYCMLGDESLSLKEEKRKKFIYSKNIYRNMYTTHI